MINTGIYLRLSAEEKEGGEKLKNQEALLQQYILNQADLKLTKVYRDNGYSGTSFNRPGWWALMEDVKHRIIQCIVVKDLSRLGRNYIEAGNYLEIIFPFMGIRFISVNDSYDSFNPSSDSESLLLALKNLANEAYARDIAKKVFTTKETQRKNGLFYGSIAPYGYWKDEADPHRLVINPETAPIVHQIYQWKLEGTRNSQIAHILNQMGAPAPMKYLYDHGVVSSERFANNIWQMTTIKVILSNRTYTGDLTQGKKRRNLAENQRKVRNVPKEDWVVVENTHEPIISRQLFFQIQAVCEQEHQANLHHHSLQGKHSSPAKETAKKTRRKNR